MPIQLRLRTDTEREKIDAHENDAEAERDSRLHGLWQEVEFALESREPDVQRLLG